MILFCFGTRPEWLKIKPVLKLLDKSEYKIYFTGQHSTLVDLTEVNPDYVLHTSNNIDNRLDQVVINCLTNFPEPDPRITSVLVQGDTASAFACALAAFHRKLKLYYLEAGLRTQDLCNPYPEEGYRQMISRLADVQFCPTTLSWQNLLQENIGAHLCVVGNTVLDNIRNVQGGYGDRVLVTLHRRENHDVIQQWFIEINKLAEYNPHLEFILPIHPNPNVLAYKHILSSVTVVDPLDHEELIDTLAHCKLVITDSGGLQEEGAFLNKRVIVCRKITERPEGIDTGHSIICDHPNKLFDLVNHYLDKHYIEAECPYGDGYASERIVEIIRR